MTPVQCPSCQQPMELQPGSENGDVLAVFICPTGHHVTVTSPREAGLPN